MLPLIYLQVPFAIVRDPQELLVKAKGFDVGISKAKTIFDQSKLIFGGQGVTLYVAEGADIYKMTFGSGKAMLGELYYLPKERRIDIWQFGDQIPLVQMKGKKIMHRTYGGLLEKLGIEKIFERFFGIL